MVCFCIGISHRLSRRFLIPRTTTLLFFMTTNACLLNKTSHPLSQSCPIEIKDALRRFGRIIAVFAPSDSLSESGNMPFLSAPIFPLSGNCIEGPSYFLCYLDIQYLLRASNCCLLHCLPLLLSWVRLQNQLLIWIFFVIYFLLHY